MFETILFYAAAVLMVIAYTGVVCARNTVNSALWLILALLLTAVDFALIQAPFLAVTQLLVYAGGVMVLFLFITMIVSTKTPPGDRVQTLTQKTSLALLVIFYVLFGYVLYFHSVKWTGVSQLEPISTLVLARNLFIRYRVPFELVSVILLVSAIGSAWFFNDKECSPSGKGGKA